MSNRAGVWWTVQIDRADGFRDFSRPFVLRKTADEMMAQFQASDDGRHTFTVRPVVAIDADGIPFYREDL